MWLPKTIINKVNRRPISSVTVENDESSESSVSGAQGYMAVEKASPYGIAYSAPKGMKSVIAPVGDSQVCVGVISFNPTQIQIEEGELLLFSSGGAKIYLKNDGTVVINGQTFSSEAADG